jgi:hypothetical protein
VQFYICRYAGTGTIQDPYRPNGVDTAASWTAIDLRGIVTSNDCFLELPDGSPAPPNSLSLGTHLNLDQPLTNPQTAAVNARLGTSLPNGLTRRQAIDQVLGANVLPETVAGELRRRIYLGGTPIVDTPA